MIPSPCHRLQTAGRLSAMLLAPLCLNFLLRPTFANLNPRVRISSRVPFLHQYRFDASRDNHIIPTSTLSLVLDLRAGDFDDGYDEEYDEEYDGDDEEEDYPPRRGQAPPGSRRRPQYDHKMTRPPPRPSSNSRRAAAPRKKKTKHWSQRIAEQSLQKGGQFAWNAVIKQPSKVAYHLIRPKHVDLRELQGLWRLDQQITIGRDPKNEKVLASVATVLLDPRRQLVSVTTTADSSGGSGNKKRDGDKDQEQGNPSSDTPSKHTIRQPFTFSKTRFGSYKTSFVAPAFLVGSEPRWYGYKGTWQRKLADAKVIKLVGKIYAVRKVKFGKQKGQFQMVGKPLGTFVARRRMQLRPDEEDDDDYDEEYDDDEYDADDEDGGFDEEESDEGGDYDIDEYDDEEL